MCILRKKGAILKYSVISEVTIWRVRTPGRTRGSRTRPAAPGPGLHGRPGGLGPGAPRTRSPARAGAGSARTLLSPSLPGCPGSSPPFPAGRAPRSGTSESRGSAERPGRNTPRLRAAASGAVTAAPRLPPSPAPGAARRHRPTIPRP